MSNLIIRKLVVAYPSGNTTAIVFDDLETENREQLNTALLKTWADLYPDLPPIEQCCFVKKPTNPNAIGRVEMFGGEFCGNASRSVVWLLANGKDSNGLVETSGSDVPLRYCINNGIVTLEMPTASVSRTKQGTLVRFDGITQLVAPTASTRKLLKKLISSRSLALKKCSAVGVSNYDKITKQARFSVWVKEVDTIFDETACGSGSAAIGIALASKTKQNQSLVIKQPSGEPMSVTVRSISKGSDVTAEISGTVQIIYSGTMKLQGKLFKKI